MIKNIKVDLIYYTIGNDFEMEFNLCGCCRMRLLSDSVQTRTEFSKCLARGVSRSNVIISCGPIFGEKGLISTVSKVTSIPLVTIDNSRYRIADKTEISVLKGSIPLVTSDGVFCGCIIENGPQVIILLTESKSLRKKVMKELVHPYISQWSYMASPFENSFNPVSAPMPNPQMPMNPMPAPPMPNNGSSISVSIEHEIDGEEVEEKPIPKVNNDGFIWNDPRIKSEAQNGSPEEKNSAYFEIENVFGNTAVEKQNIKYYLEQQEDEEEEMTKEKPKNMYLIFLIILTSFVAIVILFVLIIRPFFNGYDIADYLKGIFTPQATVNLLKIK